MKVKFIWFDDTRPDLMTACFQKWSARASLHPTTVRTSMLSLWKSKLIALVLPHYVFSAAESLALERSALGAADPPPPVQKELVL